MNKSESIKTLATALVKAQKVLKGAKKEAANPFFKSRYADLQSVWDAAREPLTNNGLSVVQLPGMDERGYYLDTILMHESGEFIEGRMYMKPVKDDPQGIGSACTYSRRYALQSLVGICPEDDDGETAMGRGYQHTQVTGKASQKPNVAEKQPVKEAMSSIKPSEALEKVKLTCVDKELPEEFLTSTLREHGYLSSSEGLEKATPEVLEKVLENFTWFLDKFQKDGKK